jgi:hypothetical protein
MITAFVLVGRRVIFINDTELKSRQFFSYQIYSEIHDESFLNMQFAISFDGQTKISSNSLQIIIFHFGSIQAGKTIGR